jgi:hypothetical protein
MNFNVKWCYKKKISLLLDCYLLSQNVSTYILYENHPTFKIILCHFNLYSFNFGKSKGKYPRRNLCQINFGETIGDTELKTSIFALYC